MIPDHLRPPDSPHNWPDDYPSENGCYQNRCFVCKEIFYGHKRRIRCKVCWETPPKHTMTDVLF